MKLTAIILSLMIFITSCEPGGEDLVESQNIPKSGTIETTIETVNKDSFTLMFTNHYIWKNNVKVISKTYIDTLPTLGKVSEVGEDSEGNTKTFIVPKNYEIFITVK